MALFRKRHGEMVDVPLKTPETDLSDDEDDNSSEDLIKTGWKLYEKIFSFLDTESLLCGRHVCKRWNQIICRDSLLFTKIRVKIPSDAGPASASVFPSASASDSTPTPFAYSFNCPNLNFESHDFRSETIQEFLTLRGNFIKHLKLTNCLVTLPRLQSIMIGCVNIEHFELDGVHPALVSCERIFPKPYQFRCLPNLRTLILKSVLESNETNYAGNSKSKNQDINSTSFPSSTFSTEYNNNNYEVNLLPGFLQDLVEYSENLVCVHLINFSGKTSSYFMNIVNQRARYRHFKEFHATQLRPTVTSVDLIPLCVRSAHIRLTKLTLSPASPSHRHDFGVMIIRGILRNYRATLEYLDVTNCPVTAAIFKSPLPKLRVLIVVGTNISSTALFRTLTPNLEKAVFQNIVETPRETIQRYLSRYNLQTPQIPSMAIQSYIANRLGYFRGHYLVDPLPTTQSPNFKNRFRRSVIKEFHACSTFDFVNLVLFGISFILLLVFALSAMFKAYSSIIFISFVLFIFAWEVFGIWTN